jgi:uncharacterized protein
VVERDGHESKVGPRDARRNTIVAAVQHAHLRRFAASFTLFPETTLAKAFDELGFVQADPIRAPARAQDLVLRQRVASYRAGDLDRLYPTLDVAEDFFVNYGFVTRRVQELMHPRPSVSVWSSGGAWLAQRRKRARQLLAFVRRVGEAHPREVDARFPHGKVKNYWGGTSNATTHLLDAMHYRGILRVTRREGGVRIYAAHEHAPFTGGARERAARLDALVDVVARIYAPLPASSLAFWVRRLRHAAPQWRGELTAALKRAKERRERARVDGVDWYWPAGCDPAQSEAAPRVRLLAPFDPVVQDRARFELLWGWVYRFEAYTPPRKRKLGYYALPMLWRDAVIGWANARVEGGRLDVQLGYVAGDRPRERAFGRELDAEIERMRSFLGERE